MLTYLRLGNCWRRPWERTHCPRHWCFEDSPLISWARVVWPLARQWTQLLWRAMETSEPPRQGANLSTNRVDFSSSVTISSPPVPTLPLRASERGESVKETIWTNQHRSPGCDGKEEEGREEKRAEERGYSGLCTWEEIRGQTLFSSLLSSSLLSQLGDVCWFVHVVSLTLSPPLRGT